MDETETKRGESRKGHPKSPFSHVRQPPKSHHEGGDKCGGFVGIAQPPIHAPNPVEENFVHGAPKR